MQIYDANTNVLVRQSFDCKRKLAPSSIKLKGSYFVVGNVKIDSLTANDEVLMIDSNGHTYYWEKFGRNVTVDREIKENFYELWGSYAVGGSGFRDEISVQKIVHKETPIVCRVNGYKKVIKAEDIYKLGFVNDISLYGYCRDIKHNSSKLEVVELPLIIDKCSKTVAISSVRIDLPDNLFILTRKDSDYIF